MEMSEFEQHELGFPGTRRANLKLRRGIYLLPSSMTVANMLCGFYAVMATLKGGGTDLDNAAKAIGLAILFDSFDGFVARATGTSSEFGKQFDSLADMVSFGIAPAALAFTWGVRGIAETDFLDIRRLHQIGWWVALSFVICCAWRLARFNIQGMAPGSGSKYFVGLPCPAAAGLIAATVHGIKTPIEDWRWSVFWMLVVIADAALMSSTVRYRSFKDLPMAARQRSIFVIVIGLLVWLIVAYSEVVLMVIATVFVASGVTLHVVRVLRHYLVSHPAKT
jgi:CDP-diacylglycerol--serine O-phosphatidyltransferase